AARRPGADAVPYRTLFRSLLTLSAGSAAGLDAWAARLADHLRDRPDLAEGDVCRSAALARDERPHRLAVVVDGDLRERLAALRADRKSTRLNSSHVKISYA